MYKILGREIVGNGRKGRFIIEYSRPWPTDAKNIYLIGEFTNWFPGFIKLRRQGSRGYARLKLWPGTYPYGFITDNNYKEIIDPENPETLSVKPFIESTRSIVLSKSIIPIPDDPLDMIVHSEEDDSFLHRFGEYIVIRLLVPETIEKSKLVVNNKEYIPTNTHLLPHGLSVHEYVLRREKLGSVLEYKFRLVIGSDTIEYGDEGIADKASYIVVDQKNIHGVEEPKWWMGTIYYQIFVDSFENGDPNNDPPEKVSGDEIPRRRGYLGGDLRGIIKRLYHIVDLGAESLYLTPIFKSSTYHRYDVCDYYTLDPYLGDMKDYEDLVKSLRRNNIRLVLDIPLHHTGACFEGFIDALKRWEKSPYWNFYLFKQKPPSEILERIIEILRRGGRAGELARLFYGEKIDLFYETFFNVPYMPKINHDNVDTLKYFVNVLKYWVEKGADGFRIDVGLGILYWWLKAMYHRIRSIGENILFMGETSDFPAYYAEYYDAVMDYYWRKHVLKTLVYKSEDLLEMIRYLNRLYQSLPQYKQIALYHALGTHDTPRIKTIVKDKKLLKTLYVLLFVMPGSPAIYYGDEIGLEGGPDPDNRRKMIWEADKWDEEIYTHIKKLVMLYKSRKALRHGFYNLSVIDGKILVITRVYGEDRVVAVINTSNEHVRARVDGIKGMIELFSGEQVGDDTVDLGPYGYVIAGKP